MPTRRVSDGTTARSSTTSSGMRYDKVVPDGVANVRCNVSPGDRVVRHFRQILVWPIQLMPIREGAPIQKHWERLQTSDHDNPWRELVDEFTGDPSDFQERHYSEFVTFLPFVQRFLYGEGKGTGSAVHQESSI